MTQDDDLQPNSGEATEMRDTLPKEQQVRGTLEVRDPESLGRIGSMENQEERHEEVAAGANEAYNAVAGDGDLSEDDDSLLLADGYEDALIGTAWSQGVLVALYDADKCVEILVTRDGMSLDEAHEYFNYNTLGAYVGRRTPIFAHLDSWGTDEQGYQDLLSRLRESIEAEVAKAPDEGEPQLLDGTEDR